MNEFLKQIVVEDVLPILQGNYLQLRRDMAKKGPRFFEDPESVATWKKDGKGLVTQGELEAERAIRAAITAHYPDWTVIGEELADAYGSGRYTAVIDPLDGSSTMIRSIIAPERADTLGFGISIGVLDGADAVGGIIFELLPDAQDGLRMGRIWHSFAGGASMEGGRVIAPAPYEASRTDFTLISTAPEVMFKTPQERHAFHGLERTAQAVIPDRNCIGFMDLLDMPDAVVMEADLSIHDAAAVAEILKQAGITVTDHAGKPLRFDDSEAEFKILAAQPALHARVLARYQRALNEVPQDVAFDSVLNRGKAALNVNKFQPVLEI